MAYQTDIATEIDAGDDYVSSSEALRILGVKPQTLYANVSRGRVRTQPSPEDSRRSLYNGDDVKALAGRSAGRRSVAEVATHTISFGEPVLASGVSTIAQGRLWYRGEDVVALAEHATLEEVAALIVTIAGVDRSSLLEASRRGVLSEAQESLSTLTDEDLVTGQTTFDRWSEEIGTITSPLVRRHVQLVQRTYYLPK